MFYRAGSRAAIVIRLITIITLLDSCEEHAISTDRILTEVCTGIVPIRVAIIAILIPAEAVRLLTDAVSTGRRDAGAGARISAARIAVITLLGRKDDAAGSTHGASCSTYGSSRSCDEEAGSCADDTISTDGECADVRAGIARDGISVIAFLRDILPIGILLHCISTDREAALCVTEICVTCIAIITFLSRLDCAIAASRRDSFVPTESGTVVTGDGISIVALFSRFAHRVAADRVFHLTDCRAAVTS